MDWGDWEALGEVRGSHLDGQGDGVEEDEDEHEVLKGGRVDHGPDAVLAPVAWDVAAQRLRLQRVLHALPLRGQRGVNGGGNEGLTGVGGRWVGRG